MKWLDDIADSMDMSFSQLCEMVEDGSLVCYSPWGRKELDTTERLNSNSNHSDSGSSLVVQASLSQAGVQGRVLGAWLSPPSPAPPEFS